MNVTINIDGVGTLCFDMTAEQLSKMIASAFAGDTANYAVSEITNVVSKNDIAGIVKDSHENVYADDKTATKSKVERMFGNNWRNQERSENATRINQFANGYKGFLLLECPSCGKRKAFCTKTPIHSSFCSCGYEIEIKALKRDTLDCKCGKSWKYMTNINANNFTHNCLSCGTPVDIIYNPRHGNFETLG